LRNDSDRVHESRARPSFGPRWNAGKSTELLQGFIAHKNVPIFNLEITRDGQFPPESIAIFRHPDLVGK